MISISPTQQTIPESGHSKIPLRDSLLKKLAEYRTIVDPVCELLGGTVRFDHSKLNFKHPEANTQINWY